MQNLIKIFDKFMFKINCKPTNVYHVYQRLILRLPWIRKISQSSQKWFQACQINTYPYLLIFSSENPFQRLVQTANIGGKDYKFFNLSALNDPRYREYNLMLQQYYMKNLQHFIPVIVSTEFVVGEFSVAPKPP